MAIVALVGVSDALACICSPGPPAKEHIEQSDLIVRGTIVSIRSGYRRTHIGDLQVSRMWKGPDQPRISFNYFSRPIECGLLYEVGQEVLIFAKVRDGRYFVNICWLSNYSYRLKDFDDLLPGHR